MGNPKSLKTTFFLLVLLAGLGGVMFFWFDQDSVDVIPVPVVKSLAPHVSLEWGSKALEPGAREQLPEDHPGYTLAIQHCTRCHLLPSPSQVPRETWPFVLTWMSNYLGYTNLYGPFQNNVDSALMPSEPVLGENDLRALSEYYLVFAPDAVQEGQVPGIVDPVPLAQFRPTKPPMDLPADELITLTHWDVRQQNFYIGRGAYHALQVFDRTGRLMLNKSCDSEPVGVESLENGFRLSLLGDFLEDKERGQVMNVTMSDKDQLQSETLVEGYHRLTQTLSVDLNQDGHEDLLLVGFGAGVLGRVSVFWGNESGRFESETVLFEEAGALNAKVHDMDGDGRLDVLLLIAQQYQELLLFRQDANGSFSKEVLIKQFAGYGYNQFDLVDWNKDGRMDLLMVNGNNMEIKNAPLKPYHGIRILLRKGEGLEFEERHFYPMHGAIKAVAEDFDLDGDLDLAAIAFYPDWSLDNPQTFVYLENRGEQGLQPSIPTQEHWGRWMTMDTGDFNRDGFPDILLGGAYVKHGVHSDYQEQYQQLPHPSLMIMENLHGDQADSTP